MNKKHFYETSFSIPNKAKCTFFGNGFSYSDEQATGVTSNITYYAYSEPKVTPDGLRHEVSDR